MFLAYFGLDKRSLGAQNLVASILALASSQSHANAPHGPAAAAPVFNIDLAGGPNVYVAPQGPALVPAPVVIPNVQVAGAAASVAPANNQG